MDTQQACPNKLRSKFSKEEDDLLLSLFKENPRKWDFIASKMNRTSRQVKERYENYLDPTLNINEWSLEEETLLDQKVKELGTRWVKIARFFENRSPVNVKNHWATMLNRRYKNKYKKSCLPSELSTDQNCPKDQDISINPSIPVTKNEENAQIIENYQERKRFLQNLESSQYLLNQYLLNQFYKNQYSLNQYYQNPSMFYESNHIFELNRTLDFPQNYFPALYDFPLDMQ